MSNFQLGVYVGLIMAIIFLLSGLSILVFGKKTKSGKSGAAQMQFSIGSQSMSMPYNVNLAICIIGVLLLFLTFNLIIKSGEDKRSEGTHQSRINIINIAYGQTSKNTPQIVPGWIYFGYEKNPASWNFEILNGDYGDLLNNKSGLILRSKAKLNIREDHFGNFTGTILGFLDPAPKIIGELPAHHCITVSRVESVGFDKIWVNATPTNCP